MTRQYLPSMVPAIALAVRQGMDPSSPERPRRPGPGGEEAMTAAQQPIILAEQRALDSAERDDGPNPLSVVFWLAFATVLIFGAGVYVGFTANVDAWYLTMRSAGL